MATKLDVLDAVHELLATTISNTVDGINTPYEHVRLTEQTEDAETRLPAYTLDAFASDETVGLGGDVLTADTTVTGAETTVTKLREKELTLDIAAHAAGDDARMVSTLYAAAEAAFVDIEDRPEELHADVRDVNIDGTTDVSAPDTALRGDRLRVRLGYRRYFEQTEVTMQDIDVTLTVDDSTDTESTDSGSAIDVTYETTTDT